MSGCLDPAQLDLLASGGPGPTERRALEAHVARCDRCRAARDAAVEDASLFDALRDATRVGRSKAIDTSAVCAPNTVIDGYRLEAEIHRGPRGAVYRAEEADTGRQVAVKILLGEPWTGSRDRSRFQREIELAAVLDHRNIVRIEDSGSHGDLAYFVMPWIDGVHFDAPGAARTPDLATRLRLFARVCRAVAYAHRRGVIHRDLKPANILVDATGEPRILDFGLAKLVQPESEASHAVTWTGQFLGTPAYASPEQVDGTPADITTATDVYALGVLLYQLVTGSMPYDVEGPLGDVVENIRTAEPRDPGAGHDFALRAVLLEALEKRPERRYASADALADDLERYLAGEPVEADRAPAWYVLRRAYRRHRRALGVHAAILVACTIAVTSFLALHFHAESQRQTADGIQRVLRDLITAAHPDRMGGGVALVDLLNQVATRIEDTLEDAPDVQAAVELTIGDTYFQLLMMPEAHHHLRAALERFRAIDEPPAEMARTLHLLAQVQTYRGQPDAVLLARRALAAQQRQASDTRAIASAQRTLAFALMRTEPRDLDAARRHLEAALAAFEHDASPDSLEIARTRHRFAELSVRSGRPEQAELWFDRATQLYESPPCRDTAWAVECFNDYASYLQRNEEFARAEQLLSMSTQLTSQLFGEDRATDVLRRTAELYLHMGDTVLSEQFSLRAVGLELRSWAHQRPQDRSELEGLAERLQAGFGEPDAREALLDAFRALRDYRGCADYEIATWLNDLARVADAGEHDVLARALLREALIIDCRTDGGDGPRLTSLELLARSLCAQGPNPAALETLREALELRRRSGRLQGDGRAEFETLCCECGVDLEQVQ